MELGREYLTEQAGFLRVEGIGSEDNGMLENEVGKLAFKEAACQGEPGRLMESHSFRMSIRTYNPQSWSCRD